MLNYISIKNIVLIEKLELNFEEGFTVLTGETGAGKSIIVDAINLILGNRADKRLIKKGESEGSVSALFSINNDHEVISLINKYGLTFEDEIILRRKILSNGRSQSFFNEEIISLSMMKEISKYLVEVSGQNEQVGLLENANHIKILDDWGNLNNYKENLINSHKLFREKAKFYNDYKNNINKIADKKKYLIEDIDEINKLELKDDEIKTLIEKKHYLTSIEKIKESLSKISFLLKGSIDSDGVYESLINSKKQILSILSINKELFLKLDEAIDRTLIEYKETEAVLAECLNSVEESNFNLDEIENRISHIKRIARKHNIDESEINSFRNELESKLNNINDFQNNLKKIEEEINILKSKYIKEAEILTNLRREAAIKLSKYVNREFPILKLDNAKFKVSISQLEEKNWGSNGLDNIVFKIETNKDNGFDFIEKIASGGELSRIMLAIKVSLSSDSMNRNEKTLIFDEVDTGVGGAVADAIGKRLNLLSQLNQVLAVTHHPQVAARSKNHFKVNKSNESIYTTTNIKSLNKTERLEEIARMLSGQKITDAARNAAESLINDN